MSRVLIRIWNGTDKFPPSASLLEKAREVTKVRGAKGYRSKDDCSLMLEFPDEPEKIKEFEEFLRKDGYKGPVLIKEAGKLKYPNYSKSDIKDR